MIGACPSKVERLVRNAVKRGELPHIRTQACADCGKQAQHYDHRDYNKPLEVFPVCASCNYWRGPAVKYNWNEDILHVISESGAKKK